MSADAEAAFLDDILDHPDDDTPRLVYADWLSDRGERDDEARAEFIRIQCRQARPPRETESLRPWLRVRSIELLRLFESRWLPNEWRSPDQGTWWRGFFRVQTRLWPFLTWGESWFHHSAVLEAQVKIRGAGDGGVLTVDEDHVRFLGATPLLARVTDLSVRGRPHPDMPHRGDDIARAVAGSPYARRLRHLELSCLSDAGARALVDSSCLTALEDVFMWAHVELSPGVQQRLHRRFRVREREAKPSEG
jgi:uncharacterized protein (TIGR02996 family)